MRWAAHLVGRRIDLVPAIVMGHEVAKDYARDATKVSERYLAMQERELQLDSGLSVAAETHSPV